MIQSPHSLFILVSALAISLTCAAEAETSDPLHSARNGTVLVAAHRGGYANDKEEQAPENSLENVEVATWKGFDVYETDIQRTSDGVFVIVHDPTIDRETNGSGVVAEMTLAELQSLQRRFRDGSLSTAKVATLEELLLAGKDRILFKPDLKPGVVDHFDALARLITDLGMQDQVFLRTKFKDADVIQAAFENGAPRVEVMFITNSIAQIRSVSERFQPQTIQVNVSDETGITPAIDEQIQEALKLGMVVEAHCYRDPILWQDLADKGVRMFHASVPEETLEFLKTKGFR